MVRDTSKDAYHAIKRDGLLSKRRWEVYHVLYENGPMTGGECFQKYMEVYGFKGTTNSNTITRLSELRDIGVVKELGTRICSISGREVILWDVTKNLPIKLDKKEKIKCPHCKGKGYFIEQQSRLF